MADGVLAQHRRVAAGLLVLLLVLSTGCAGAFDGGETTTAGQSTDGTTMTPTSTETTTADDAGTATTPYAVPGTELNATRLQARTEAALARAGSFHIVRNETELDPVDTGYPTITWADRHVDVASGEALFRRNVGVRSRQVRTGFDDVTYTNATATFETGDAPIYQYGTAPYDGEVDPVATSEAGMFDVADLVAAFEWRRTGTERRDGAVYTTYASTDLVNETAYLHRFHPWSDAEVEAASATLVVRGDGLVTRLELEGRVEDAPRPQTHLRVIVNGVGSTAVPKPDWLPAAQPASLPSVGVGTIVQTTDESVLVTYSSAQQEPVLVVLVDGDRRGRLTAIGDTMELDPSGTSRIRIYALTDGKRVLVHDETVRPSAG